MGVDVSRGMIREAEAKRSKMGLPNIRFRIGSAVNLGVAKADFVVSTLAFHHVRDKTKALSNIHSKLTDGGKVVLGDWFKPDEHHEREVAQLRKRKPKLAKEFDTSWERAKNRMRGRYAEEHPKKYPISQAELARIMEEVGFRRQVVPKSLVPAFSVVVGEK